MKLIWSIALAVVVLVLAVGWGQATSAQSACDPAYPDFCIASPPPDVDCGDIEYRSFRVFPPDPHHFDGDGNGIGCEVVR